MATHQFFVMKRPSYLSADNWQDDLKPMVIDYLNNCLDLNLDDEQSGTIRSIIDLIDESVYNDKLWQQSEEYNKLIDVIRDENHVNLRTVQ